MKSKINSEIKQVEKEIKNTRKKFIKIMKPHFEKDIGEVVEIKGGDLLFYGDCAKREAKLETLQFCQMIMEAEETKWIEERGRMAKLLFKKGVKNW